MTGYKMQTQHQVTQRERRCLNRQQSRAREAERWAGRPRGRLSAVGQLQGLGEGDKGASQGEDCVQWSLVTRFRETGAFIYQTRETE